MCSIIRLRRVSIMSYLILILFLIFAVGCDDGVSPGDPVYVDVAVYTDFGSWDVSVTASIAALRFIGFSVDTIGIGGILNDRLGGFRAVLFPGGDPRVISGSVGKVGRMKIKSYVASGGGFIGFGGGAAIADSGNSLRQGIGLFHGSARCPVEEIAILPNYTMTSILLMNPEHPVGYKGLANYLTLYYGGPQFEVSAAVADVIYNFERTNTAAAIAFQYAGGRVFLSGFQPEIEENDDRDSTDFGKELHDTESEWDIIHRAVRYCIWDL